LRLVAGGWFVLREKYCWLVADKPSEQADDCVILYTYLFLCNFLYTNLTAIIFGNMAAG
jgi:hypothetical protein